MSRLVFLEMGVYGTEIPVAIGVHVVVLRVFSIWVFGSQSNGNCREQCRDWFFSKWVSMDRGPCRCFENTIFNHKKKLLHWILVHPKSKVVIAVEDRIGGFSRHSSPVNVAEILSRIRKYCYRSPFRGWRVFSILVFMKRAIVSSIMNFI